MRERKSKSNLDKQQNPHQSDHISPFKFAKLFDPEASWDKRVSEGHFVLVLNSLLWVPLLSWFERGLDSDNEMVEETFAFLKKLDQLGDVLHWIRQVVAILCGLLWGAIPLVGGLWIILFLVISSGIVYGYYALVLKIDEEEFGGHGTLLQEGLFASFTLFLLAWVMVYSLAHF